MLINSKVFAAALIFCTAATPAWADSYYVAIDLGRSTAKDICTGLTAGVSGCTDTAALFRVAGGYQFGPRLPPLRGFERKPMFGVEASYGAYDNASAGTVFGSSVDWQISGLQLSGIGTFPIADAFSLLLKLGIARTDIKLSGVGVSVDSVSTNLAYGVGAQYDFTKNISARFQYENLGDVGDSNTTGVYKVALRSAGVVFKFR